MRIRKKRPKALFSEWVGRAGLIRPLASPYGQRCALSYRYAMLEPERRISPARLSGLYQQEDKGRVRWAQMRKKRQKALFSEWVGRAGLIRPVASPYGQRCALSYRCAMLEPERRISPARLRGLCQQEDKGRVRWRRCEKSAKRRFFLNWWVVQDSNLRPID